MTVFQYPKAAACYVRADAMTDAVRLFETLRDFRRAVEVLVNKRKYDAAIDVLKRYEIFRKVKDHCLKLWMSKHSRGFK